MRFGIRFAWSHSQFYKVLGKGKNPFSPKLRKIVLMRNLCELKCEPNRGTIDVRGHVRGRKVAMS